MVYFVEVVGLQTTAYLKWNPTKMLCQKFDERVVCSMNYINKQKKKLKEHLRLVLSSIGVGVVVKTDDKIYFSSNTEIHSYFSLEKIEMLKNTTTMEKWYWIQFKISPNCTLLFPKKENTKFS